MLISSIRSDIWTYSFETETLEKFGVSTEQFARAVIDGDRDAVKKMIDQGANPSVRFGGDPLVLIAAHKGHEGIIRDLVAGGADVNADNGGKTALVAATQQNKPGCVQALIEAGADVDAIGYGNTALMLASELGHQECLDMLIQAEADTDRQGPCSLDQHGLHRDATSGGLDPQLERPIDQPHHLVTLGPTADARSDGVHGAGVFEPQDVGGHAGRSGIPAASLEQIRPVEPTGGDTDAHLVGPRYG